MTKNELSTVVSPYDILNEMFDEIVGYNKTDIDRVRAIGTISKNGTFHVLIYNLLLITPYKVRKELTVDLNEANSLDTIKAAIIEIIKTPVE